MTNPVQCAQPICTVPGGGTDRPPHMHYAQPEFAVHIAHQNIFLLFGAHIKIIVYIIDLAYFMSWVFHMEVVLNLSALLEKRL